MSFHELDSLTFDGPRRVQTSSSHWVDSARLSFNLDYWRHHQCDVSIRNEGSVDGGISGDDNTDAILNRYTILGSPNTSLLLGLKWQLENRVCSKTRWINVVGWSEALMDDLARRYLNDHGCLDLHNLSKQMLGGPIKRNDSGEFIWIQTTIWFLGGRNPAWSSVQQSGLPDGRLHANAIGRRNSDYQFCGKSSSGGGDQPHMYGECARKPRNGKSCFRLRLDISLFHPALDC